MSRFNHRISIALLAGTMAVGAAACGSSSSSSSTPSTGASGTSNASQPTGSPIKISVITPFSGGQSVAESISGAQAAAKAINASGGIKDPSGGAGHPIQIITCNSDVTVDPNAPATCATASVNAGVIASVGKFAGTDGGVSILAQAGIPIVADNPFGVGDLTSPDAYPFDGGALAAYAGAGVALSKAGATKLALVTFDLAVGHAISPLVNKVLPSGTTIVKSIYIPLDPSANLSAYIAQATQGTDGIIAALTTPSMVKVILGAQQLGYTGKYGVDAGTVTSASIAQLGSATSNLFASNAYWAANDNSNSAVAQFNKEMDALGGSTLRDGFSENSWLGVHVIANTLDKASALTSAALSAGLKGEMINSPMIAPFTIGTPSGLGLPRVFNSAQQIQVIKNGELVPEGNGAFVQIAPVASSSASS